LQLASAFGWHGHWCPNSRDLVSTLEKAFEEKGPSLVALPIDYAENPKLTERFGNISCSI
jgi:acetolactate synthase-1/2/3 large subunit